MAATLYPLSSYYAEADLKAALNAKGLITSVLYEAAGTCLIFSTPLTSKVIKVLFNSNNLNRKDVYYGDSWSSGTTIVNPVQLLYTSWDGNDLSMMVIADTTWFALVFEAYSRTSSMVYFGKLDNGDEVALGLGDYNSNGGGSVCKNITDSKQIRPITFGIWEDVKDGNGAYFTMPLMWYDIATRMVEVNGSVPATTPGLRVTSSKQGQALECGTGYVMPSSQLRDSAGVICNSAIIIDYTS